MPMMTAAERAETAADIKKNGLREPIKRLAGPYAGEWEGAIVDGRNRFLCCLDAGVEPRYEDFFWDGEASLVDLVLSWNLHRRQLTAAQRAALALQILPLKEAEAKERAARGLRHAQEVRHHQQPGNGPSPAEALAVPPPATKRDERGRADRA